MEDMNMKIRLTKKTHGKVDIHNPEGLRLYRKNDSRTMELYDPDAATYFASEKKGNKPEVPSVPFILEGSGDDSYC